MRQGIPNGVGAVMQYTYDDEAGGFVLTDTEPGGDLLVNSIVKLWYHHDRLGTTDFMTDNVQGKVTSYAAYDDWGMPTAKAVLKMGARELDLVTQYTVHPYDHVLNLYFAQARMYDAGDRRFMAVDPVKGTIVSSSTLVQYVYCTNNPINLIDLNGLYPASAYEYFSTFSCMPLQSDNSDTYSLNPVGIITLPSGQPARLFPLFDPWAIDPSAPYSSSRASVDPYVAYILKSINSVYSAEYNALISHPTGALNWNPPFYGTDPYALWQDAVFSGLIDSAKVPLDDFVDMMGPFWEYAQSQRTWRDNARDLLIGISAIAIPFIAAYTGVELIIAALEWYQVYNEVYINAATTLAGPAYSWTGELAQTIYSSLDAIQNSAYKAFTARNFRDNLITLTGDNGEGMQAHHVLPQAYIENFYRAGITDISNPIYGSWVETTTHQKWSYAYNQEWRVFFDSFVSNTPSVEQILTYASYLSNIYGFTTNFP